MRTEPNPAARQGIEPFLAVNPAREAERSELTLLPHQTQAVEFLHQNLRCLLADEVGLGKTISVLGLVNQMRSI